LCDHFSGALLLGGFADLWASFFIADSSVQYLPDQAAEFVGNYSNGLSVSQTRHIAAIENLKERLPSSCCIERAPEHRALYIILLSMRASDAALRLSGSWPTVHYG
jgi:hypothetical protein